MEEYFALWDELCSEFGDSLPDIVDLGLVTVREKLSLEDFSDVADGHDDLLRLKRTLHELDQEYAHLLMEVKSRSMLQNLDSNEAQDKWLLSVADFLRGVVVAMQCDYTEDRQLNYLMQQLFLLTQ